jgi:tetraacyldisaccharide 4'-kinase
VTTRSPLIRWPLAPLSVIYGAGGWIRRSAHRAGVLGQAQLEGPVISIGNLAVGGSSKTPVVAAVAALLREAGHPVAILSRGYRGTFAGDVLVVSDGERVLADAALAGDEPVMLARDLPGVVVAVGRHRDRVGRLVEQRFGPRVHVLDDGFQHQRLGRDLDVVCVSTEEADDWPLPAGRLREFAASLRHAAIALVPGSSEDAEAIRRRFDALRVFSLERQVQGFFDREGRRQPAPARPFAFCGIARPERFISDVAKRASQCTGYRLFRDHHAFRDEEIVTLSREAKERGSDALVTTAKDAVRLPVLALEMPLLILKISVATEPAAEFRHAVLDAAQRRRES